jgi:hypothetical protein
MFNASEVFAQHHINVRKQLLQTSVETYQPAYCSTAPARLANLTSHLRVRHQQRHKTTTTQPPKSSDTPSHHKPSQHQHADQPPTNNLLQPAVQKDHKPMKKE